MQLVRTLVVSIVKIYRFLISPHSASSEHWCHFNEIRTVIESLRIQWIVKEYCFDSVRLPGLPVDYFIPNGLSIVLIVLRELDQASSSVQLN